MFTCRHNLQSNRLSTFTHKTCNRWCPVYSCCCCFQNYRLASRVACGVLYQNFGEPLLTIYSSLLKKSISFTHASLLFTLITFPNALSTKLKHCYNHCIFLSSPIIGKYLRNKHIVYKSLLSFNPYYVYV